MDQTHTLCEALDAARGKERFITYIHGENDEQSVSFADLRQRALGILHHFQSRGVSRGDELIIFTNSNEQFVDAFWACLYGGIIPVPVAVGISDDHRFKFIKIFQTLTSPYVYTEQNLIRRLRDFSRSAGLQAEVEELESRAIAVDDIEDISEKGKKHPASPEDIAFIQFSSGSTSEPKGVVLTHNNVMTNIRAIIEAGGYTDTDVGLSWIPLTHDMGLIACHLCMVAADISQFIMDTSLFVRRPLLWLQKASEKQATVLCSPNFGYKHFLKLYESKGLDDIDLSRVRLIFNGAEPISVELCDRFVGELTKFKLKRTAMLPVYGLAEATVCVSSPALGSTYRWVTVHRHSLRIGKPYEAATESDNDAVTFMVVGKALRDCLIRIADEENNALNEKTVGHIQLKGASITAGYYRAEHLNDIAFTQDGWLDTGDLGFLIDGELVITGRAKDIIFVNGQNYYPHDLEGLAVQTTGIELGKVVVVGARAADSEADDIVVFVLHRGGLEDFVDVSVQSRRKINELTGLEVTHVIPVQRIPKTTSGKIQRHLLADAYVEGEFNQVIDTLDELQAERKSSGGDARSDLELFIKNVCDSIVIDRAVGLDDNLFEIGISSLALAQIHERIDEDFPGKIDIADLFDYPSIRALAAHLKEKL